MTTNFIHEDSPKSVLSAPQIAQYFPNTSAAWLLDDETLAEEGIHRVAVLYEPLEPGYQYGEPVWDRDEKVLKYPSVAIEGWEPPSPPRLYVSRFRIVSRLEALERLDAALTVFDQLPRPLRERWNAAVEIWSEDPETHQVLAAAGLTPEEIADVLAPG